MPDDQRANDQRANGGAPDGPSSEVVSRAARLLRTEVPVRAAWRDVLLEDIRRTGAPAPANAERVVSPVPAPRQSPRRALVIRWPIAAAASIALFAGGAAVAGIARRGPGQSPARATAAPLPGAPVAVRSTQFVLVAPNAHRVALVGDFNLWDPATAPMRRLNGTDAWVIEMPLATGRHVYAFVVDGNVTADPGAPRTAGDDFGRANSVILVSPQS